MQADRPVRGDSAPVLFDGSEDGRLLPQLLGRLSDRALDRIDMAVSFVMKSGLACILRPLGGRAGSGSTRPHPHDGLPGDHRSRRADATGGPGGGSRPAIGGAPVQWRVGCVPPEGVHLLYRHLDPLVLVWWAP